MGHHKPIEPDPKLVRKHQLFLAKKAQKGKFQSKGGGSLGTAGKYSRIQRETRVQHIMRMMINDPMPGNPAKGPEGVWIMGKSNYDCMAVWGVGEQTVSAYAGEASRRIGALMEGLNPEDVRGTLVGMCQHMIEQLEKDKDQNWGGHVAKFVDLIARLTNAAPPAKREISGPNGGPIQVNGPTIYIPDIKED